MPRIVPSQVVELIDQLYPGANSGADLFITSGEAQKIAAVLASVKEIPQELITLGGQDFSNFAVARAMLERAQDLWISNPNHLLSKYEGKSPLVLLSQTLSECPDEAPAPGTIELLFVTVSELRESIRRDISAANQDMVNGEWKGATVLAGSATEALLLWAIEQADHAKVGSVRAAAATCAALGRLSQKPKGPPERWNFIDLIEVALQLGSIKESTAKQARLGKNFRNLIHPGRAARLGEICDRAFSTRGS